MSSDCDFYVFREGRRTVSAEQLLFGVRESVSRAADEASWIDALLRCGELECAMEDAGSALAESVGRVTEDCADLLVQSDFRARPELLRGLPQGAHGELTVSTPEGFAYYALHPLRYADAVERLGDICDAVVVGIRSIGVTLSAVTSARLRHGGARVQRFSVRPEGHPFERSVQWNESQLRLIGDRSSEATFVVVDEGPGLSGSSFLSVAEALCNAGVPEGRIILMSSYAPDSAALRARDATQRWARFRCVAVGDGRRPQGEWIGTGNWRPRFLRDEKEWPGAWTNMERAKFLSGDGQVLWKFEGLGPYGDRARTEAYALDKAGFGVAVVGDVSGFVGYQVLRGRNASPGDLNAERIRRIAAYCTFRGESFRCEVSTEQRRDLETMLRVNFEREFGNQLHGEMAALEVVRPAVCDAKMAAHEWFVTEDGGFLKLDATAHGDDHFFPGPCDVAWDLAGAIVEWKMDSHARGSLLREYRELSGDDASVRTANYVLAYAVFRFAWCRMAAAGMKDTPDEQRLLREYRNYRACAERIVALSSQG
jgi:hypothetical protein